MHPPLDRFHVMANNVSAASGVDHQFGRRAGGEVVDMHAY